MTEQTRTDGPTPEGAAQGPATPDTANAAAPAELEQRLAEVQEKYLRLAADFDNFKKRAAREREDTRRAAIEALIARLLPTLDNFDMAMAAAAQPNANLETLKTGVAMVHSQLRATCAESGLEETLAQGQPFDPAWHEAVAEAEAPDMAEGLVSQVLRKGYRMRERLIRPASVVVSRRPSAPSV